MSADRIVIMAGGTGGHVFPGLALVEEMSARGYSSHWLGTAAGLEAKLVPERGIPLHFIPVKGLRGKGFRQQLMAPVNLLVSVFAALRILRSLKPALVVGLGGFVAGPGGAAAKLLGIPLIIHEQNAVAGTTNKILARMAKKVLLAFPGALPRGEVIGNPVRREIENLPPPEERQLAQREHLHLLVVGGSRGALAINELLPTALAQLPKELLLKVRHQAGAGKADAADQAYSGAQIDVSVTEFIDDMPAALAWADVAICRAGALTVSELAAVGIGAVFIPFPYAIDDHQTANARYLEVVGAAVIRQQAELTAESLADLLTSLLADRERLLTMAKRSREAATRNSAQTFANHCEALIHG